MEEGKRKARGRPEMPDSGTKMQRVTADCRRMDVREMGEKKNGARRESRQRERQKVVPVTLP